MKVKAKHVYEYIVHHKLVKVIKDRWEFSLKKEVHYLGDRVVFQ